MQLVHTLCRTVLKLYEWRGCRLSNGLIKHAHLPFRRGVLFIMEVRWMKKKSAADPDPRPITTENTNAEKYDGLPPSHFLVT
ncbi:hypothetical protein ABHD89_001013 [Salinicoccus halitifaciens]|uniref:Uncharacterized protein n=1 Tax=Salinicoccus halitifaciens TaxID=1073415 RepID=A0ABV2E8H3_9STAP